MIARDQFKRKQFMRQFKKRIAKSEKLPYNAPAVGSKHSSDGLTLGGSSAA